MKVTITVKHRDGELKTHRIYPDTEVRFEEEFSMPVRKAFSVDHPSDIHTYKLAYFASYDSRPFEEWLRTVDDMDVEREDNPPT